MDALVLHMRDADTPEAGGKAATLARLASAGMPVPAFFVVDTAAYRSHVERLRTSIPDAPGPGDLARIREAIVRSPLHPTLIDTLRREYAELGGGPVAVRSSGTAEDLPASSFAGQHGTWFAPDEDTMLIRVVDCWASLWSDRAFGYRVRSGTPHSDAAMAVIVQRLVRSEASGVAFSADPITGARLVTIEACRGIGEALVSGRVCPDRWVFSRPDLDVLESVIGRKPLEVVVREDGTVIERRVTGEDAMRPAIDEAAAIEVAHLAVRTEGLLGEPADIEWASADGTLALLQARPITTLPDTEPPVTSCSPTVWSNVNTGEVLPGVVTPMTHSVVGRMASNLVDSMLASLGITVDSERLTCLVGGRLYFNASMLGSAFGHLQLFGKADMQTLFGGMDAEPGMELPATTAPADTATVSRFGLLVGLPRFALWVWAHRPKRAEAFITETRRGTIAYDARIATIDGSWTDDDVHTLASEIVRGLLDLGGALAYAGVGMLGYNVLANQTRRWLGDETGSLANRLLGGRGGVDSADAGLRLAALASLARAQPQVLSAVMVGIDWDDVRLRLAKTDHGAGFVRLWDSFMAEHGHHTRGELEMAAPRWSEQPEAVLASLRALLTSNASDLEATHAESGRGAAESEREALERLGPLRRTMLRRTLAQAVLGARTRENVKSEGVRRLAAGRAILLVLGRRLTARGLIAAPDDIFYLRWDEVADVMAETAKGRDMVAARRELHERWLAVEPPPVVIGEWDGRAPAGKGGHPLDELHGLAVSPGVARGHARVIASVLSEERLLPGEILVAPFTDPGWTPWFAAAAGIVVDMGGMLSHGSIIAREYGLPAVVNVAAGTKAISSGDLVEVDGDRGVVRVLERRG